jgi:hypothetical protein
MLNKLISEILNHMNKEKTRNKIREVIRPWVYRCIMPYYLLLCGLLAIMIVLLIFIIYLLWKIPG